MKKKSLLFWSLITVLSLGFYSCSDSDDDSIITPPGNETGETFFVSVDGESAEYILQLNDINSGTHSIAENISELEQSGYTWIFNDSPSMGVGLIYQQGDPGIGLGVALNEDGQIHQQGQFQITSRYTSYGFFDQYALTSVGGRTPVDAEGNALTDGNGNDRTDGVTFNRIDLEGGLSLMEQTITTLGITGTNEQATFSGVVDMGDGTFLTGLVMSLPRDPEAEGGSSSGTIVSPDSVWVARLDADFNVTNIYRDDRLSYSSGRYRSQYYSQIAQAADGTVYVFSGSYETTTTKPAGALRINSGANEFDPSYYFNIEAQTNGLRFRRVWHISGDDFLLEFYNMTFAEAEADESITNITLTPATQYAIVNMSAQTFNWVEGLPDKDAIISTGLPMAHDGNLYFPITAEGADPALYIIDPATHAATVGLTVTGASAINAVGLLSAE